MTAPDQATAAIRELRQVVDWLAANLLPGTAKPYRAPESSAARRAARDAEARRERLERSGIAPGESPAPFDLDIADLLSEILTTADDLADRACWSVHRPVDRPAGSAFEDPARFFDLLTRLLPAASTSDPTLAGTVEEVCDGLIFRAHRLLGLLGDGQLLNAVCPWCTGRGPAAPVGGDRTMRVRAQLPPGKRTLTGVDPKDVRWLVVCEGVGCEPPAAECGERHRGRPAWPLRTEGEWLAGRIEATLAS